MGERLYDWYGCIIYREPPRDRRIRERDRMKAKARWLAKHIWRRPPYWQKRAEQIADHLAHCSKPCCNKRRFWDGPTFQEKRENQGDCHEI